MQISAITLKHRVVMAPPTRSRSNQPDDIPGDLMAGYYTQRASDGGFIISEATAISISGRGWYGAPGIYLDAQVAGWNKVIDAAHAKGGRLFLRLWHTGRASHVDMTGGASPASASAVPYQAGRFHTKGLGATLPGARSNSQKFRASWTTIAKPPSGRSPLASTVWNCTAQTDICPINFSKTAATSAPMLTAVPSRTALDSC